MKALKLPLGIENFSELISGGCYYIDKTGFIKELLEETFKVNLITRPRRFGKTLTMSMLAEFLDIRKDSAGLFHGLEISRYPELCRTWMNQWPVLFLTLKDANGRSFTDAYGLLEQVIAKLCIEHSYLERSLDVSDADKNSFRRLMNRQGDDTDVQCALDTLLRMMHTCFRKPVVLLIDEYDVPLAKAYDQGYYEEMLNVMRSMLGMAWKTNNSLKFAVITGCLRIAKESIFTGANNFVSRSVAGKRYDRFFGFTEKEVLLLLKQAGLEEHLPEMKRWYDGYRFGTREVYCPWDVVNHVSELLVDHEARPANYWKDTSHNNIIRSFIDIKGASISGKIETLLAGGMIFERVIEDQTYELDHSSEDNLWSILYLAGYLTQAAPPLPQSSGEKTALRIPNEEVKTIFAETVAKWFSDSVSAADRKDFFRLWWEGNQEGLTRKVSDILFDTISYFDYKEDYYHAFMTGLFSGAGYEVVSNREMGDGRADIVIKDRQNRRAILIEVKRSRSADSLEKDCTGALEQIRGCRYAEALIAEGYETVLCYGAAFWGKRCMVRLDKM